MNNNDSDPLGIKRLLNNEEQKETYKEEVLNFTTSIVEFVLRQNKSKQVVLPSIIVATLEVYSNLGGSPEVALKAMFAATLVSKIQEEETNE
jgi:hypothetical protein